MHDPAHAQLTLTEGAGPAQVALCAGLKLGNQANGLLHTCLESAWDFLIFSWAWSYIMLAMRGMIIMDVGRAVFISSKKVDMSLKI